MIPAGQEVLLFMHGGARCYGLTAGGEITPQSLKRTESSTQLDINAIKRFTHQSLDRGV